MFMVHMVHGGQKEFLVLLAAVCVPPVGGRPAGQRKVEFPAQFGLWLPAVLLLVPGLLLAAFCSELLGRTGWAVGVRASKAEQEFPLLCTFN